MNIRSKYDNNCLYKIIKYLFLNFFIITYFINVCILFFVKDLLILFNYFVYVINW